MWARERHKSYSIENNSTEGRTALQLGLCEQILLVCGSDGAAWACVCRGRLKQRSKASSKLKASSYKAQGKTSCRNARGEQVQCRKKKLLGKCDEIPNTEKNLGQG